MKDTIRRRKSTSANLDGDNNQIMASVHWTSPKVLENPTAYSRASDIYSLGIILWELMTRKNPYEGMSPAGSPTVLLVTDVFKSATPISLVSLSHL